MNALPSFAPSPEDTFVPDDTAISPEAIDERAAQINADTSRVVELFHDEAIFLRSAKRGTGHIELIELSVLAMNAWPVIEKTIAGIAVTPDEGLAIPAFFRALKPLFDQRAVLVREAAEEELQA